MRKCMKQSSFGTAVGALENLEPRIVLDGAWSAAEGASVFGSSADGGYLTVTTIDIGDEPIVFERGPFQGDDQNGGQNMDGWQQIALLTTDDGMSDAAGFADPGRHSLGVHGERLILGAPSANDGLGAAAVFEYRPVAGGWVFETLLTAPGLEPGDGFGWSVGIHGNTAVIGTRAGNAAFVFRDSGGWSLQTTLSPAGDQNGRFGHSVATDGSRIAVGAPGEEGLDDDTTATSGAVYIFERDGNQWPMEVRVDAPASAQDSEFGHAVAIHSGSVIVGAWMDDDMGEASGSVIMLGRDSGGWVVEAKMTPNQMAENARFGADVSAHGSRAAAIALGSDAVESWAQVFKRRGDRWSLEATLEAGDDVDVAWRSVAMHGDRAVLGSGAGGGAAAVFFRPENVDAWNLEEIIRPSDEPGATGIGHAVAMHDNSVLLGGLIAPGLGDGDDPVEVDAAAWVFRMGAGDDGFDDDDDSNDDNGSDDNRRLTWTVRSLGSLPGVGTPVSDILTWTDRKDGRTYAAVATDNGLVLYTRDADRTNRVDAWSSRVLTSEIAGAEAIAGDISVFGARGGQVYIVGYTADGDMVIYRQDGTGGPGAYGWTFENITERDLDPRGFDTPRFVNGVVSFVTRWDALNIAGLDDSGRVRAVWTTPGLDHWRSDDLSSSSGAPALAGRLAVFLTPWGGINLAGTDDSGALNVTWWVPGFAKWVTSDFNALFDGPEIDSDSVSAYTTPWGGLNITGRDSRGDLVAYWWVPQFGESDDDDYWRVTNLSSEIVIGDQPAGTLQGLVSDDGEISLFGTNAVDDVVRYYWTPGDRWRMENLTHISVEV